MKRMKEYGIGIIICLTVLTGTVAAERPTVIITFDDGWYSVLQNAKPIMDNNNQKGVDFIITNQPELSWNGQPNNYMNVSQLQQLYDSGWDISSHTYSHANLTTVNSTTLNNELSASYDWLDTNGYPRGAMFLAYPEGSYNAAVIAAVQANHYVAARTVDPPDANYSNYNLTSPDVYMLKAYEIVGGIDNDITVIDQINNTIAANGLLILAFHKIVDDLSVNPSDAETEFRTSDFQNVSNYLQSRSPDVDVRTLSDYFGAVPLERYIPPIPEGISATMGPDWINTSWSPGIGNVTDVYNVNANGTWFNGTLNTYVNITAAPGVPTNVSVYAVNTTNGSTVNPTPISLTTIIPLPLTYIPSIPANLTAINGNDWILINWEQGAGENITDMYNVSVNNLWNNGTVNTSYKITAIPGTVYDIKIYAINTTNGTTLNTTPAMMNAIIPLYRPPIPEEVRQTSGNFWAYFEWDSGTAGNVTDLYSYNVDGNWTNLTTNRFVNVTTAPHGQVNISVYAFNSSNGGILNPIPLAMNLQIPNNQIEISNIWAEYDIYAGDTLRINPTAYNPDNDTLTFTTNATNASINITTGAFILNTSNGDQGTYHWNITGYDGYSSHTIDFMAVITTMPAYTPPTSPSTNNAGGNNGDGGGADTYDPNTEFYERRDSQIRHGAESTVGFFKNELVSNVTFQGVRNYGVVTVKVSILKGNPKPQYLSNAYKFFSINLDNIQQKIEYLYISNTTVTVLLNKSDLSDNTVKAYRYTNDSWENVEIEDTHIENAESKLFKLKSDGLFNFAITLEPKEPIPTLTSIGENEVKADQTENKTVIDKAVEAVSNAPESLYRTIINLIKKYMWWI